ncbi:MAG: hypothetical protein JNK27_06965 [Chitinophagaceae bacterium]|nr:hypothetical protein [Chitinophagaceae bacterium]
MKFIALVIFLLPLAVAGQSKTDYENAMTKFQKFYNAGLGDSINAMFGYSPDDFKPTKPLWTNEGNASALKEFGTLKSFKYIGIDKSDTYDVYVFVTIFSKAGAKTTSLTLNKNYSLGTFRFITTSDGINDLLKKQNSSR